MKETELRDIWDNSSRTSQITFETNQLIDELNSKVSDIQKIIRKRDLREILASLIGILIFGYLLYKNSFSNYQTGLYFINYLVCIRHL
jgi:hypothetical protein